MGQGREGSKTFLKEHPEVMVEIEKLIFDSYGLEAPITLEKVSSKEEETEKEGTEKSSAPKGGKKKALMNGAAVEAAA